MKSFIRSTDFRKDELEESFRMADDFGFFHCSPDACAVPGVKHLSDLKEAIKGKDIVCTDSLPASVLKDFQECQVTNVFSRFEKAGKTAHAVAPFLPPFPNDFGKRRSIS